ncbi:MAG: hypothetical protein A2452_01260 [Candidatus Firestonebacteria bacterium RIFOXYC2_FULL_39_67]|nr:MAG: hypothetical protein A2536_06000 [Candidatus Firestonebacteria bacterium RIFOXYD2_FULL_39_29]OGF52799.1 MAG: hypothetical protein A2497_01250 [Candidatus Firestonebacteria bacterium RifOxyC12_full_39_7]OGF54864.1 MAG: hypothetical protein A2452_01260 [Candidatus Firestonebacteria bacterium RIFOXYC2_FULL_39_67]
MSESFKLGIIGAGIGFAHAKAAKQVAGIEVAAVADLNPARAKRLVDELGVKNTYTDYKEMFKTERLDGVVIGVPNFLHKTVAIDALNAGINVLCEKPMAMNAGECEEMIVAAKKNKKHLIIGFVNRQRDDSKTLKSIVDEGGLGEIYHADAYCMRRRGIPGLGGWFTTKNMSGGGGLIDNGVHVLDLTMYQMGFPEPVSVSGAAYMKFGHKKDYNYVSMWGGLVKLGQFDVDDFVTALVRFKNGSTLNLEVSWAANIEREGFYSYFMGDKGGATLEMGAPLKIFTEHFGKIADINPKYVKEDAWVNQERNFMEVCTGKAKPVAPAEHGLVIQKIIDAIYLSSQEKREVKIK